MPTKISPAEWEVLDALWDRAPATAAEVFEALPENGMVIGDEYS